MRTIKKAQFGGMLKSAAKSAAKSFSSKAKKMAPKAASSASNAAPKRKFSDAFKDAPNEFIRQTQKLRIPRVDLKKGGNLKKAKSGKSFPDLNKDGKITRADILKGRGVIKNGGKLKKARGGASLSPSKSSTSNRLASYGRPLGKNLSGKLKKGGSVKKAMGGYKMMKMGGKCRGGCY